MKKENFFTSTLFIVVICIGFVLFSAIIFPNCGFFIERRRDFISSVPYEKEDWLRADILSSPESGINLRPKMARYLTENKTLIGKSREEVFEMLGKKAGQDFAESKTVNYDLQEFYKVVDPVAAELLIITFDDENKVEKAEIEFYKTSEWRNF